MKIACRKKWQQILLKMKGFLEPKNSKDEKKKKIGVGIKIIWKQDFWKSVFESLHENIGVRHVGFKNGPPKVAMHDTQEWGPRYNLGLLWCCYLIMMWPSFPEHQWAQPLLWLIHFVGTPNQRHNPNPQQ